MNNLSLMRESLPNLNGNLRLLHAAVGANAVDVYGNGILLASNLNLGNVTPYIELAPDKYEIQIYNSGTYDTPLLTDDLEIIPLSITTASVVFLENNLTLFTLKDSTTAELKDLAFLRFINLSANSPLLTLSLPNANSLFDGVEYLETTGYYPLSAGIYDFLVSTTGAPVLKEIISNIKLDESTFHTIFIIGSFNSEPRLSYLLTEDSIRK